MEAALKKLKQSSMNGSLQPAAEKSRLRKLHFIGLGLSKGGYGPDFKQLLKVIALAVGSFSARNELFLKALWR